MGTSNRKQSSFLVCLSASCMLIATLSGCLNGPQFRLAALPAIQGGVGQILDGIVNGVFAAIEVETPSGSQDNNARVGADAR